MSYRIKVVETHPLKEERGLYMQEVEEINLLNIIAAVNGADLVEDNIYPLPPEEDDG